MSIYSRQYQKIIAAELLRYLMLGTLPDINEISRRIGAALDKNGNITYKYIPQAFKSIFNNEIYNRSMKSIKFDIDVFHEDMLEMFSDTVSRVNFADLYHKVNSYELNNLQAQLELLLFTVKDADFYFDGAYDTFSDYTKTNTSISTKDMIDLSEQCLSLPLGAKNTQRIDVKNLASVTVVPSISISPADIVISNVQIPNTKLGNIFTDTLSVWGQEVITTQNGPLSMTVTFPVSMSEVPENEVFVSRFEVIPHGTDPQNIKISTSNDDVNYINLLGYEQGVELTDQKKVYGLDFETTLVQYVKITLSKTEADEEILDGTTKTYKYVFGLKRFAMFQTGRNSSASYVSIPFEFNHDGAINKVSIDTEQSTPPGCSVFYSVAGIFDSGEETPYIPISPVGIDSSIGSSKIVTFGVNLEKNSKFVTDSAGPGSPQVYGTSFQGKEFYRVGPVFTKNPIFGKSKLYRGYKSWYRDTSGKFDIVNITDNYVNFSNSDLAYLYATGTEVPLVTALGLGVDGIARTKLSLTKPPYYDSSKGHLLKPEPGQDPSLDTQPMYAVYKVQVKGSSLRQSRQFILSANRTQYLPFTSFLVQGATTDLPILRTIGGTPFINGVDYTFELTSVGGVQKPTGRIVIPDGSSFLDPNGNVINVLVEFAYTIDIDITHKVSSIVGNDVTLDHSILTDLDGVQITYRYVPVSPNQILKPSVRVYSAISSTSNTTFYTEGRDYTINDRSGAIQKIPSGSISDKCYVKYSYRSSDSSLNTFTTWAYISPSDGTQIKFDLDPSTKKNKLVADFAAGESFLINTRNGIVNLTNATSTPVLAMGWVQFIVRSKDPDTNVIYRSNLIDQIIQLKDVNKKKIFNSYNMYFNEIIAFREPLIEKTLNHLKVNTLLADHSCFAIDNITDPFNSYIVLNFKPNETSELYCRVPTDDSDETSRPSVSNEEFLIEWSEETDVESRPTKIKVKIDLLRASEADGSLTPKVFKYSLRVGS